MLKLDKHLLKYLLSLIIIYMRNILYRNFTVMSNENNYNNNKFFIKDNCPHT